MNKDAYKDGMMYEALICRAFKCYRGTHGADASLMSNLITAENGAKYSGLPSTKKQFEKLKNNLKKALEKFQSFRLKEEERNTILRLTQSLSYAQCADDLSDIVRKSMDATQRFKEYLVKQI